MSKLLVLPGRLLVLVASLALVASCSADSSGSSAEGDAGMMGEASVVDVATPELVAQKARTEIEPCPALPTAAAVPEGGLPDITLACLGGGRAVDLAGLRGPAVLNFWAQWCAPCRREAPIFQATHRDLDGDVSVIGVDWMDPRPGAAIALADELGLTYPQLADPEGRTRADLGVSGLPFTVFVDADGSVAGVHNGEIDDEQELADLIAEELGVESGAGR